MLYYNCGQRSHWMRTAAIQIRPCNYSVANKSFCEDPLSRGPFDSSRKGKSRPHRGTIPSPNKINIFCWFEKKFASLPRIFVPNRFPIIGVHVNLYSVAHPPRMEFRHFAEPCPPSCVLIEVISVTRLSGTRIIEFYLFCILWRCGVFLLLC